MHSVSSSGVTPPTSQLNQSRRFGPCLTAKRDRVKISRTHKGQVELIISWTNSTQSAFVDQVSLQRERVTWVFVCCYVHRRRRSSGGGRGIEEVPRPYIVNGPVIDLSARSARSTDKPTQTQINKPDRARHPHQSTNDSPPSQRKKKRAPQKHNDHNDRCHLEIVRATLPSRPLTKSRSSSSDRSKGSSNAASSTGKGKSPVKDHHQDAEDEEMVENDDDDGDDDDDDDEEEAMDEDELSDVRRASLPPFIPSCSFQL